MIKTLQILAFLLGAGVAQAHHVPAATLPFQIEYEGTIRGLYKAGDFRLLGEYRARREGGDRTFMSYRVGSYYRIWKHIKVGAFYQGQIGHRHDEDWVSTAGTWGWKDVSGRLEHVAIADVTGRILLDFFSGGENLVFEIKNRFFYNFTMKHQTYKLRPGLTYFWAVDDEPFMNFFAQFEMYIPLNYGTSFLWEYWLYGGALYHVTDYLGLGMTAALRQVVWTSYTDFETQFPGETYTQTLNSITLGALATFHF